MKENTVKVLTLLAGFIILLVVGFLLADIGMVLLMGLIHIVTRIEVLLATVLITGAWLFARKIGPSFDKLFEK